MKWTRDQQKVIDLRDRNILVSAAAGSGKTAVLVERILQKILDKDHPVDIDRMLIMTFTRAAASEMKERLLKAFEEALDKDPENENLQKQMSLIHTAQITTIHGFAAYVIRNYFHLIDLDPGYKIADEGELKLLKEDVIAGLLEEAYQKAEPDFLNFVESYAGGKDDQAIKELILKVHDLSMSQPDPKEWLKDSVKAYRIESVEELKAQDWMQDFWKAVMTDVEEITQNLQLALKECRQPGGPAHYAGAILDDLEFLTLLQEQVKKEEYDAISKAFEDLTYTRLGAGAKKPADLDKKLEERVKDLRNTAKEDIKNLRSTYFSGTLEENLQLLKSCSRPLEELVRLTLAFIDRFSEKKRQKNLIDFTDMEHFALKILLEKDENGNYTGTSCAREFSEKFDEVLVDEYQDSNLVQEYLTRAVSGWAKKKKNIFMVGDVKQSIYRFRMARPDLFLKKYQSYAVTDAKEQRIDLHMNFRSRKEVIDSVNYIFRQIMGPDLGGITYDDAAALYYGADYKPGQDENFVKTKLLLIPKTGGQDPEMDLGSLSPVELEAAAAAQEIKRMVGTEKVYDKTLDAYRPLEYGDIVILLRTSSGWAESYVKALTGRGIPAFSSSGTGYFSAMEVVCVLNYLRILDNPRQDIPLLGVLRSPIAGITSRELAYIRGEYKNTSLYESLLDFLNDGQLSLFPDLEETGALKKKLGGFLDQYEYLRELSAYTPINQLILKLLDLTGYLNIAAAMPDGVLRKENLNMLIQKAMEYEKTSYHGLFNFIRYIENLQKYQVDFAESNIKGAGSSSVRIMTIHKSKGLEFPVVIVGGMGKQFNFTDVNSPVLVHPEKGLGADAIDPDRRLIFPTLYKKMIQRELKTETIAEELRLLYVALTRAKEKLIMVGTVDREKLPDRLASDRNHPDCLLPLAKRLKAKTYFDFVLAALARHRCMDEYFLEHGILMKAKEEFHQDPSEFEIEFRDLENLEEEELLQQIDEGVLEARLREWDAGKLYDASVHQLIQERFAYRYPYESLSTIPVKQTVSDLKKRKYLENSDLEEAAPYALSEDLVPLVPQFISQTEEQEKREEQDRLKGTAKGNAYHKFLEFFDYAKLGDAAAATERIKIENIKEQIEEQQKQGLLHPQEAAAIKAEDMAAFFSSSLGRRMTLAAASGRLVREQPFVMGIPALGKEGEKLPETTLIQGIIDAYFIEENGIVLLDYKTDRIYPGQEDLLIDRYRIQLDLYSQALTRALGLPVKEKYIYSFARKREIRVM